MPSRRGIGRETRHPAHARADAPWRVFWAAALTVIAGFVAVGEARVLGDAVEQGTSPRSTTARRSDAGAPGDDRPQRRARRACRSMRAHGG
jgi:hypothetical protein